MGMLAKIRRMYFRDKLPLHEIARQTGLSRNTLRHWLRQREMREPAYPKRSNPSQLDPYKDQLVNWLRTDSQRPKRDRRTAKVLFQLIQAQGYPGGYARVAICLTEIRLKLRPIALDKLIKQCLLWAMALIGGVTKGMPISRGRLSWPGDSISHRLQRLQI